MPCEDSSTCSRNCDCDPVAEASERSSSSDSLSAQCTCSHVKNWHVRADQTDTHCAAPACPCPWFERAPDLEPPMTPEEEEEAPGDAEEAPLPPQPDRRPPYAVAYSVQGHLYEVALSGDATVRAMDGALVIQHRLGPVAGIVQVLPVTYEGGADGAEADQ